MWSKTKWALEQRLADSLKNRVSFSFSVKRTFYSELHVMYIHVDSDVWFASNPNSFNERKKRAKEIGDSDTAQIEMIRDTGLVGVGKLEYPEYDVTNYIHQYLNELSIDEAFTHDNYFIRLLAVLDGRIGKRRLRPLLDNIDNEPEWFRKWIRLRCEAEGMVKKTESQSV
jgi:hypothetical protein